jgi:uncharacterized membrane protein YesL
LNIFHYESKFNQLMMTVADVIILNLLYILCSLPVVTIGAAQAGLFTGIRVLLDPEDDSSPAKAFFRGFSNGFAKITAVFVILMAVLAGLIVLMAYTLTLMLAGGSKLPFIISVIAAAVIYIIHSISGPFHATFGCTVGQLLRNSLFVFIAYPLRSLATGVLVLLPLAVLMIWPNIFLGGMVAITALYYGVAYLMIFTMMKKPFQRLKDSFYAAQNAEAQTETEE